MKVSDLLENESVEKWKKENDNTKIAIVDEVDEPDAFTSFYCQILQNSPIGWIPVSQQWKFGTRVSAREKIHRMGYTLPTA